MLFHLFHHFHRWLLLCSAATALVSSVVASPKPQSLAPIFIISFDSYRKHDAWAHLVDHLLSSRDRDPSNWQVLPRNQQVSSLTDFVTVQLDVRPSVRASQRRQLKRHQRVISITPDISYSKSRQLKSLIPSDSVEDSLGPSHNMTINHRRMLSIGRTGRRLPDESISEHLQANQLWRRGIRGQGVRVAVFDTGLRDRHPHFAHIEERLNWTDEGNQKDDTIGHGTVVASLIAGTHSQCQGLAPDAMLLINRVFTSKQMSYTSWFLDALNHALQSDIDVLNLSIGGPDFMDQPFVRKVRELTSSGILFISALGNDGPRYGTLNNPADQADVIGVAGLARVIDHEASRRQSFNQYKDIVATYSSRGMTTWELPDGYGRVKPDISTFSKLLRGSSPNGGCRTLSGTSVASPVVAGASALLISALRQRIKSSDSVMYRNPMLIKQTLMATAERLQHAFIERSSLVPSSWLQAPNIFEQGAGKLDLIAAHEFLMNARPHLSAHPASLDLTDCPFMFPLCAQPLFWSARPLIINITLLSSLGAASEIVGTPTIVESNTAGSHLQVSFQWSEVLWPWSGTLAVVFSVSDQLVTASETAPLIASGRIRVRVRSNSSSPSSSTHMHTAVSEIDIPFRIPLIAAPSRSQRILFDQFHSLRYPSGFFPRDNLDITNDLLDWNGDHLHTNFRAFFVAMRQRGFFVDVLGNDYSCINAALYSTLVIADPEDEFADFERQKFQTDVVQLGLSVLVLADWYSVAMIKSLRFFDENTHSWWTPVTGGSNLPALNQLLEPFGIAFGARIFKGQVSLGKHTTFVASGSSIIRFPANGSLVSANVVEVLPGKKTRSRSQRAPLLGWAHVASSRIAVFSDSNCVDSSHMVISCVDMIVSLLRFTSLGIINPAEFGSPIVVPVEFRARNAIVPARMPDAKLQRYSRVLRPGFSAQCTSADPASTDTFVPLLQHMGPIRTIVSQRQSWPAAQDDKPIDTIAEQHSLVDEQLWRAQWTPLNARPGIHPNLTVGRRLLLSGSPVGGADLHSLQSGFALVASLTILLFLVVCFIVLRRSRLRTRRTL